MMLGDICVVKCRHIGCDNFVASCAGILKFLSCIKLMCELISYSRETRLLFRLPNGVPCLFGKLLVQERV